MIKYTMYGLMAMYALVFTLFIIYPFIDIHLWLYGIVFGWFFHWIVGSIIIHRYITHRAFKVNKILHNIFILLSTLVYAGSSLAWASTHRLHHVSSDTKKDPHSSTSYNWWQLLGLILVLTKDLENRKLELLNCKDLLKDKMHLICHKYYIHINIAFILILGLINVDWLIVFWIGIAYHMIGVLLFETIMYHNKLPFQYKNHDLDDNSYNNLYSTLFFHGEAYHNNHHKNPSSISNTEKWYEFDLNNIVINLIKCK